MGRTPRAVETPPKSDPLAEIKALRARQAILIDGLRREREELLERAAIIEAALAELGASVEQAMPPAPRTNGVRPESHAQEKIVEELRALKPFWGELSATYRKVVELRTGGMMPINIVAAAGLKDRQAVNNVLFRARVALRKARARAAGAGGGDDEAPAADDEEADPADIPRGCVQRNGNGYRWRLQVNGRQLAGPTVDTPQEAEEQLAAARAALALGKEPAVAPKYRKREEREAARAAAAAPPLSQTPSMTAAAASLLPVATGAAPDGEPEIDQQRARRRGATARRGRPSRTSRSRGARGGRPGGRRRCRAPRRTSGSGGRGARGRARRAGYLLE